MQVQVKTNVLAKNDAIATSLQQLFKEKNKGYTLKELGLDE